MPFLFSHPLQVMDDALQRARKLAEQAVQQIGKVSVRLVRVQVSQIQTHPERRFVTPEGRDPVYTFVWQPVHFAFQMEATFTYTSEKTISPTGWWLDVGAAKGGVAVFGSLPIQHHFLFISLREDVCALSLWQCQPEKSNDARSLPFYDRRLKP